MRRTPVTLLIAALLSSSLVVPVAASDQPPSTLDLLPGVDLVTEEVEPGVYRVASDEVRELSRLAEYKKLPLHGLLDGNITAGLDGSVWWFGPDGFFRLGDQLTYEWPKPYRQNRVFTVDDFAVAPDGTLWRSKPEYDTTNAASFDGQSWTERSARRSGAGIEVQDDGTVWTAWKKKNGDFKVGRLTEDGWQALPGEFSKVLGSQTGWPLAVAANLEGDVWLFADDNLYHHDNDRWQLQSVPATSDRKIRGFDVGPEGTVWVRFESGIPLNSILARFDGIEWTVYDESFDIPSMGDHFQGLEGWFEVASNGSIWFDPIGDWERTGTECDGVANFDGESLTYYLRDICIYAMDVAQDGRVWLQAGEYRADVASGQSLRDVRPGPIHTYVITPEAVAATE